MLVSCRGFGGPGGELGRGGVESAAWWSLCLGDQPGHIGEGRKAPVSPGLVLSGGICYSMVEG